MTIDGNWQIPLFKTIKNFEWGVMPLPHNTKTYTGVLYRRLVRAGKGASRTRISPGS